MRLFNNKKTDKMRKEHFGKSCTRTSELNSNDIRRVLTAFQKMLERDLCHEVTDDELIDIILAARHARYTRPAGGFSILGTVAPFRDFFNPVLKNGKQLYENISFPTAWRLSKVFGLNSRSEPNTSRQYDNIILHIPHSSTDSAGHYLQFRTKEQEKYLVDYYTDELFVPCEENERIHPLIFPITRAVCDVERMIDDPMKEKGYGIIPTFSENIWDQLTYEVRTSREELYRLYNNHHNRLANMLLKKGALLLDCHSFSVNCPFLTEEQKKDAEKYDICIGYNEDMTRPDDYVIGSVRYYFEKCGYRVGDNKPFSNSMTVQTPKRYHSLMIEINKRLYMNEETLEKTENFTALQNEINGLYDLLLREQRA